jgi:hypothetical protein
MKTLSISTGNRRSLSFPEIMHEIDQKAYLFISFDRLHAPSLSDNGNYFLDKPDRVRSNLVRTVRGGFTWHCRLDPSTES